MRLLLLNEFGDLCFIFFKNQILKIIFTMNSFQSINVGGAKVRILSNMVQRRQELQIFACQIMYNAALSFWLSPWKMLRN